MDSVYAGWLFEQFNTLGYPKLVRVLLLVPQRLIVNISLLQRTYLAFSLHNLCSSITKSISVAPNLKVANLQLLTELNPSKKRVKRSFVPTCDHTPHGVARAARAEMVNRGCGKPLSYLPTRGRL